MHISSASDSKRAAAPSLSFVGLRVFEATEPKVQLSLLINGALLTEPALRPHALDDLGQE